MRAGLLAACLLLAACSTTPVVEPQPVRVILVGDSTMQARTGYGDALCARFKPNVTCVNLAKGGRSTLSFRAEGLWANVLAMLADKGNFRATYVLIQFGHNDQPGKPGRSTDLASEFPVNLARYVDEANAAGAITVLVTPLTRRIFKNNVLQNDLIPWADATRLIAQSKRVPLLELNAESSAAVAKMGGAEADTFAMGPPPVKSPDAGDKAKAEPNGATPSKFDYTHLGAKGADYFARMVAQELAAAVPALASSLQTGQ